MADSIFTQMGSVVKTEINNLQTQITALDGAADLSGSFTDATTHTTSHRDVLPDMTGGSAGVSVYSLGSATAMWKDVFIGPGSLYVNGKKVLEESANTMVFSADTDQNIQIKGVGAGDIELVPGANGTLQMKGAITMGPGLAINAQDLTVAGDLTVSGTTTTVSTQTVLIEDNLLTLNSSVTGPTPATGRSGIEIERGDTANASIQWSEEDLEWQQSSDGITFEALGSGSGGGSSLTYSLVSTATAAVKENSYIIATGTAAVTVTLPASPTAGDLVKIIDGEANASTNNITVARNGSNIMGLAEDMTVSTDNANFILVFIGGTKGWMVG